MRATGTIDADDADAPLVAAIARGDARAFARLVDRHLARVHAIGVRMLGNAHDAEDVAQEVFERVWTRAAAWRPGAARFRTWICRVAINACQDRLRARRPTTDVASLALVDPGAGPDERGARQDLGRRVRAALAALPPRQRAAIVLSHYEGLSGAEAAVALDVSLDALESLLARGRRALRPLLADLDRGDDA